MQGVIWSPSKMIARMGREINNPDSVYYWAYKVGDTLEDYVAKKIIFRPCKRIKSKSVLGQFFENYGRETKACRLTNVMYILHIFTTSFNSHL